MNSFSDLKNSDFPEKVGRNEPCPCGSGKKFKKCHGVNKARVHRWEGAEGVYRVAQKLHHYPEAQELANTILPFFGEKFTYEESGMFDESHGDIVIDHEQVQLKYGLLQLKTSSDRVTASLVHELLHLEHAAMGRPIGEVVGVPDYLKPSWPNILGMYRVIHNIVDHEININQFLQLGFERKRFLEAVPRGHDYESRAKNTNHINYDYVFGERWWLLEFFRLWYSSRHLQLEALDEEAQRALEFGSSIHPELKNRAVQIREWTSMGEFHDRSSYLVAFNQLLDIFDIPKFTSWAILEGHDGSAPSVKRIQVSDPG